MDATFDSPTTVVRAWGLSGLVRDLREHGDSVLRRASVALIAGVVVVGGLAYQQAGRIATLSREVATNRRLLAQTSAQLDTITRDHSALIAATSNVPAPDGRRWASRFTITQYIPRSPAYGRFNDGFTSTMMKADPQARIVAVDPALIPYGSQVWIEGLGWYSAQDCGSAIKGRHLDVLTATASEAFSFGKQERFVIVVPAERGV